MSAHKPDHDDVDAGPRAGRRWRVPHITMAVAVTIAAAGALVVAVLLTIPDHNRAAARPPHVPAFVGPTTAPLAATPPALAPPQAEVGINAPGHATSVPRSFFGLSTEYSSLPVYEQHLRLFERVLTLLHVRGNGPLVVRVGGDSADDTFWEPNAGRTPPWAIGLTPQVLARTRRLVRRDGVKLILDLNLITGSPRKAARLARAAERALPRGSIIGFEIGNEPDDYSPKSWLATVAVTPFRPGFLPDDVSTGAYTHDFSKYGRALAKVAPGVPLAGPALANPVRNAGWISSLLASPHRGLGTVTAHRYLYSACARHRSGSYPTIARLLSDRATADMARRIEPAVRMAHRAGFKFRLTELNSVSCQGVPGVSDSFATALWAPDALFALLRTGLDGVNIHVRTDAINAAFTLNRHGLGARPLLYGMILFARTLSSDPRLVHATLHEDPTLHLKAWAVRVSGGIMHVLLINKGAQAANVHVDLPGSGPAKVERLLAPSAASVSGVTLAGQHLGPDGRWHGRLAVQTVTRSTGGYEVAVPATSAALLSVRLRRR
jgi:Glycosyl hydrolase family 79 C-terminal beta domain